MDDSLNMPPITAHLSLLVDAMYLNAAEKVFEQCLKGIGAVDRAMKKVERLNQRREAILEKHDGNTYTGQGIPKNATEAAKWFRAAVEQDHVAAKFNLGVCYLYGEGVAKDEVEAYKWISLSAAEGHADAKKALPTVEGQLTSEQLAEGQRLARAFKPRKPPEEGGFDSK